MSRKETINVTGYLCIIISALLFNFCTIDYVERIEQINKQNLAADGYVFVNRHDFDQYFVYGTVNEILMEVQFANELSREYSIDTLPKHPIRQSVRESFSTVRAWYLTELGKIYIDTL